MPIYEYQCLECGHEFEKIQKFGALAPPCPECGEEDVSKKVSQSSFHLKGGGWYVTDYKAKPAVTGSAGAKAGEGEGGSGSESGEKSAEGGSGEKSEAGSGEAAGKKDTSTPSSSTPSSSTPSSSTPPAA